jgi:hypothetical protein
VFGKKKVVVKTYRNNSQKKMVKQMSGDANKMANDGYFIAGTSACNDGLFGMVSIYGMTVTYVLQR